MIEPYSDKDDGNEFRRYVADRIVWLTRLRWMAVFGIVVAVVLAQAIQLVWDTVPFYVVATILGTYNLFFWNWGEEISEHATTRRLENIVFYQMLADMVSLTILIHYAGGIQNPFVMFFVFHAAIGAMMLPWRRAFVLGTAACVMHGGTVVAEATGILSHWPLWEIRVANVSSDAPAQFIYPASWVAGYLTAFVLTISGVTYFVSSVASRLRRAEDERDQSERIALSRERMARIGEISAGVAHNIRNPLHGMLNCVELFRDRHGSDESSAELIDLMSEGFSRICRVIDRLLVLTQDKSPFLRPTDVNALVEETLQQAEIRAREKELELNRNLAPLPEVPLDAEQFCAALLAVVTNAIDASPVGSSVSVETSATDSPIPGVQIEVTDQGPGIPQEHLSRIFDPFYSTKAIEEGTGLGLAIAQRVIREHAGTVSVESRADGGACVCLKIPSGRNAP